ncbi:hypothetical protein JCM10207_003227 [Rhodosporidiobolus poonsookiae]
MAPPLPREVLHSMCILLSDSPTDLAAFALSSKLLWTIATPILYRRVELSTRKQWSRYKRTWQGAAEDDSPAVLAYLLQFLHFLPSRFYVVSEDEERFLEAQAALRAAQPNPDSLDLLAFLAQHGNTPSPSSSGSAEELYEDETEPYDGPDEDRWVCHAHVVLDGAPVPHRTQSLSTLSLLQRLVDNKLPASTAYATFCRLLRPPGANICAPCLSLAASLSSAPASNSPFKALTSLTWTLLGPEGRDEDLLILLGTDVVPALNELTLRGTLARMTRELDLLIRCSVARDPLSPPGVLLPPVPPLLTPPATPSQLTAFFGVPLPPTPQRPRGPRATAQKLLDYDAARVEYDAAKEAERKRVRHYQASWVAQLSEAEREGEEVVRAYRGPSLAVLDAREVRLA